MKMRCNQHDGYSLVEIMVALTLFALVLALGSPAMMQLMDGATRNTAATSAQVSARATRDMIQDDLERALSGRPTGNFDSAATGSPNSISASLTSQVPQQHDIVLAGRTQLGFFVELFTCPGVCPRGTTVSQLTLPEYVQWSLEQNQTYCGVNTPNWCIVRRVWTNDRSVQVLSEVATSGRGAPPTDQFCAPGLTTEVRIFCYERNIDDGARVSAAPTDLNLRPQNYQWNNPGRSNRCTQVWSDPATTNGITSQSGQTSGFISARRNSIDPPYNFQEFLDTITSVGVVIPSTKRRAQINERGIEYSQISIQSRQSPMYQASIMCGNR